MVMFVINSVPEPPKLEGALEVNDLLTRGERLFENEILGPESIVFHKGTQFAIIVTVLSLIDAQCASGKFWVRVY